MSTQLQCFPCHQSASCLCGYFTWHQEKKCLKMGKYSFYYPQNMTGGEAKSEASVVTVAAFHLLKMYLIC